MKITINRTGGMLPLKRSTSLDTKSLPAEQSKKLEELVEESNFFSLKDSVPRAGAADYYTYSITIEKEDGSKNTVKLSDFNMPKEIKNLLKFTYDVKSSVNK
jgi:hypothetical protein